MASDKNSHLVAAAKLARKHGVKNFSAVCPLEHNLAWSEDSKSFHEKASDSVNEAASANPKASIFKTNLVFGPETHLIHFLTQCALVGKVPYKNLVAKDARFHYAPVYSGDIAAALDSAKPGVHSLNGPQQLTLREIMDVLEAGTGRTPGSTGGPLIPEFDYLWDFLVGTTSDLNMSRMVAFYEKHPELAEGRGDTETSFREYYEDKSLEEDDFAHPTMTAYKCAHTD